MSIFSGLNGRDIARNVDLLNLTGEVTVTPESAVIKNLSIVTGRVRRYDLSASLGNVEHPEGDRSRRTGTQTRPRLALQGSADRSPRAPGPRARSRVSERGRDRRSSMQPGNSGNSRSIVSTSRPGIRNSNGKGRSTIFTNRKILRFPSGSPRDIEPGDVVDLMPSFDLPDFRSLGATTLTLDFDGRPLDFRTKFEFNSSAGNINPIWRSRSGAFGAPVSG